jgi:protein arginine N-methyltransferase 5
MITSPITTPHFHSRVLALLSSSLAEAGASRYDTNAGDSKLHSMKPLVIPPLSPVDTSLTPDESISQIVATSSTWTDLCSPDPFIAAVSADILKLEVAYAAFCGISYVLIPGPRLRRSSMHDGSLARYARAILEALSAGPYIQIQIWMPIIDHPGNTVEQIGDLAPFARPHLLGDPPEAQPQKLDLFGTWAAWDLIRSICKYHTRLCVGELCCSSIIPLLETSMHYEIGRIADYCIQ